MYMSYLSAGRDSIETLIGVVKGTLATKGFKEVNCMDPEVRDGGHRKIIFYERIYESERKGAIHIYFYPKENPINLGDSSVIATAKDSVDMLRLSGKKRNPKGVAAIVNYLCMDSVTAKELDALLPTVEATD